MEGRKEVTIECGSDTKLLTIDFTNYDETMRIIRRKFGIPGEFKLKVTTSFGKGKEFTISDDDDLYRFRDSEDFVVRPLDQAQVSAGGLHHQLTPQPCRPEAAACTPPPSYEQSVHAVEEPQTTASQSSQRKVPVVWDGTRKLVNFDMNSLANTKAAIRNKFTIVGDFDILGKLLYCNKHYNIQNDDDLNDYKNAESFVVKRRLTEENRPKNQSKLFSDGKSRKMLEIDMSSLDVTKDVIRKKFAIVGDFYIRGMMPGDNNYLDIQNNDDLNDCRGAHLFLVERGLKAKQSDDELAHTKVNLKVKCEAHDKFVTIDLECLRSTRNAISQKFNIDDEFKLLVKKNGVGEYIDVEDDKFLATLTTEDVLLVERKSDECDASELEQIVPRSKSQVAIKNMSLVKVGGGEEYSIIETPEHKSRIVEEEAIFLQNAVCIPSISAKLAEVGECLRIAYYGTVDNKVLRCEAQKMQFDIQKLCEKCDLTMLSIERRTCNILDEMKNGFHYLLVGYEDFGLKRLGLVGPIAEGIQKDAEDLTTLMSKNNEAGGATSVQVNEFEYKKANPRHHDALLHSKVSNIRFVVKEKRQDIARSELRIERLAESEGRAVEAERRLLEADSGIGFGFMKLITLGFHEGNKPQAELEKRLARQMREEQVKEKEMLAELKKQQLLATIEFDQLVKRMKAQTYTQHISEVAIQAAQSGFKTLQSSLQSLGHFWESIGIQFNSLNNVQFLDELKSFSKAEDRKAFWKSDPFKSQAMTSIARFVAVQKMCRDFHDTMAKVLNDIHHCIEDNPTPGDAKKKLPHLVEEFEKRRNRLQREANPNMPKNRIDPDIEALN